MTRKQDLLGASRASWLAINIVLFVVFGTPRKNNAFQIQNEFKLDNWVAPRRVQHQPGRAVPVPRRDC